MADLADRKKALNGQYCLILAGNCENRIYLFGKLIVTGLFCYSDQQVRDGFMLKIGASIHSFFRALMRAAGIRVLVVLVMLNLSGCSAGDIQFEGKLFEAVGLDGSLTGKRPDPKVTERSPLVLPPAAHLPEPGKRVAVQDTMNWPDDPDLKRKTEASLLAKKREKYCREIGRNPENPFYDEEKAVHCSSLISKGLSKAFGRAPENESQ